MREVLYSMDLTVSEEDLEHMMFQADIDGNGKVCIVLLFMSDIYNTTQIDIHEFTAIIAPFN